MTMDKYNHIQRIKEIYDKGENIIKYLKNLSGNHQTTMEDIIISYDFQAGSYIKDFSKNPDFKIQYGQAIAYIINQLGGCDSIVEVGVGEGTTLCNVINKLDCKPTKVLGFDISWSRLKFAKEFIKDFNLGNSTLFVGNLFEIPLLDDSVEIVYTSHSIEPNGGKEKEALSELYRITKNYLILLEPAFELAGDEAKKRMVEHGYVTNLYSTALELCYKIVEYRPFEYSINPLNPTGLMIIEKKVSTNNFPDLKCPVSLTNLIQYNDSLLHSKESMLSYPIIDDIPCLLKENSILTTKLLESYNDFKNNNNIHF